MYKILYFVINKIENIKNLLHGSISKKKQLKKNCFIKKPGWARQN